MHSDFRSVFCPTNEEKEQQYEVINRIIRDIHEHHGDCCAVCKHEKYVQESPYYSYTTCEFDKSLVFAFADDNKVHYCDKYEFTGYLHVKEK